MPLANVLVTGGAGFIGSHLVDALVDKGHAVTVLDNLTPQVHPQKPAYLNRDATYRFSDVRDKGVLKELLADSEIVYHLAAAVGVGQSMYQVEDYVAANTMATATLLQTVLETKRDLHRLVVASSMSIYGEGSYRCPHCGLVDPGIRTEEALKRHNWEPKCPSCGKDVDPIPTAESKPLAPTSIYAITKRDQEEMCLTVGRAYGIPTVALRFFNVYGPRQQLSNPYTGVCAIFQSRIQNGRPPVIFEDGSQTRDFVSVHDIVQALLLASERREAAYSAINVGTGRPTSIRGVAELLLRLYGKSLPLQIENTYRAGDVRHCYADISRAEKLLGYKPRVPLEEGLQSFIEWSRAHPAEDHLEEAHKELSSRGLVGG